MYYKILKPDGVPCNGGSGVYHLPKSKGRPGKWMPKIKDVECCKRGYHVCTIGQVLNWVKQDGLEIWECEVRGANEIQTDKSSWEQIRLVKKTPWSNKVARLFSADCAERVLHLFEKQFPEDKRPREAIQAARDFANGKISQDQLDAAGIAAYAAYAAYAARTAAGTAAYAAGAAGAAAWDAAGAAAYAAGAAGAAAWDAAGAAAWDAAGAAENKWQTQKLKEYLEKTI